MHPAKRRDEFADRLIMAFRDLTELGPGDERLRQTLAEQQAILDGLQVGVGYFVDRRVVWVNRRCEAMFQRSMEEVHRLGTSIYFRSHAEWTAFGQRAYPGLARGEDVTEVGHRMFFLKTSQRDETFHRREQARLIEHGSWEGEHWARKRNGEEFPVWLSLSAVRGPDERVTHIAAVLSDISERKRYEAHLEHLARHDPLTGLPNRQYLLATLERETGAAAVGKVALAVLFIDLDRFKIVNDTLGHAVGAGTTSSSTNRRWACRRSAFTCWSANCATP